MTTLTRFAPSPNGFLHLGHGYSAWLNREFAQAHNGRFLVRIEDLDQGRRRQHFVDAIFEDLAWLGIFPDAQPAQQSDHVDRFEKALATLRDDGLLYRSFVTRSELKARVAAATADGITWPRDPDGAPHCPAEERARSARESDQLAAAGQPFAWRLNLHEALRRLEGSDFGWRELEGGHHALPPDAWGDVILMGKDQAAAYHLAVVVDDAAQNISHVIRGVDLAPATALHRVLQLLLGLPAPFYHHHHLILDAAGEKLSKSKSSMSLRDMREMGVSADTLLDGFAAGLDRMNAFLPTEEN